MTVRVGIVGAGGISRSHVAGLAAAEDAVVSSVYDLDLARAKELADTCSASATDSIDELLDTSHAVVICTPTASHRSLVEQVAARGLAVFCEKPLAPTLAEAEALGAAVAAAGVINQVGLPLRRQAPYAVLHHLLANPDNGALLGISMHTLMRTRARALGGWRGDVAIAGGGMLIEVGFHDIDLLQWLGGPAVAVSGHVTPGARPGIEDAATVSMRTADGASVSLLAAWNDAPIPGQSRRIHAVSEHAEHVLTVDADGPRLSAHGPGDRNEAWDRDGLTALAAELGLLSSPQAAFVRSVRDDTPATPSIADAVAVHRILDTVYATAPADSPVAGVR